MNSSFNSLFFSARKIITIARALINIAICNKAENAIHFFYVHEHKTKYLSLAPSNRRWPSSEGKAENRGVTSDSETVTQGKSIQNGHWNFAKQNLIGDMCTVCQESDGTPDQWITFVNCGCRFHAIYVTRYLMTNKICANCRADIGDIREFHPTSDCSLDMQRMTHR